MANVSGHLWDVISLTKDKIILQLNDIGLKTDGDADENEHHLRYKYCDLRIKWYPVAQRQSVVNFKKTFKAGFWFIHACFITSASLWQYLNLVSLSRQLFWRDTRGACSIFETCGRFPILINAYNAPKFCLGRQLARLCDTASDCIFKRTDTQLMT